VDVHPLIWAGFVAFVLGMLSMDLFLFHREAHEVTTREASMWTAIWMTMGLSFTFVIWAWQGGAHAGEYIAGYLLEYSLSADNIFVFVLIFGYFAVPKDLQHRVLFWGILGALVFRAGFIIAGAALLERFEFMFYVFGGFLVITGIRMAMHRDEEVHPERNPLFRLFRRCVPAVDDYRGGHFTVVEAGKRYATPLLLVLAAIETTDLVFAVDSIPAIFAVTKDPFIVYTSNIFAILGLRALYFALAGMMGTFHYLKVGLSLVLVFVGVKMLLSGVYTIPIVASLGVIVALLAGAVVASQLRPPTQPSIPVRSPQGTAEADQPTGLTR
jgi:tellurite resistance protein TerC